MRSALSIAAILLSIAPASAEMSFVGAGQNGVMSENSFGCRDQDDETAFRKLVSDDDQKAAISFGNGKYPACKRVRPRTTGTVEDLSFLHGTSCFRPRGEPYCLWLPTDFIAKLAKP